jgi:hypothetical protein
MGTFERRRCRPVEKNGLLRSGSSANNCECQLANVLLQQFHGVPVAPAGRYLHHLPNLEFAVVLADRAHAVFSDFAPCNESAKQRVRHGDIATDVTAASLTVCERGEQCLRVINWIVLKRATIFLEVIRRCNIADGFRAVADLHPIEEPTLISRL